MTRANESTDADLHDPLLERLGEGADLPLDRRRTLVDRIAAAPAAQQPARRRLGVWWVAAAAAAAAAVVAGVTLWPARPEPISPTALVGDLLGPLPNLAATTPAPPEPQQRASPTSDALTLVWEDLEDPLAIIAQAVEAPRALLFEEPSEPAPAGGPDVTKEN
ncbi:MAG: hypothetical protein U9R68_06590 [Planctomycetota bacterium]|nr:hypothetical protein [Planctomycetota bacterium]